MPKNLRVLFIEDSEADTDELVHVLTRAGFALEWHRVESAAQMQTTLHAMPWDIIISDHFMPGFSGTEALRILRESALDLPFIVVSGMLDDSTAVDAMKAGATDFFRKGQLARLGAAIERELLEFRNRRERDAAKRQLDDAEQLQRLMIETARDFAMFLLDPDGSIVTWNTGAERMFGLSPSVAIGRSHAILYPNAIGSEDTLATALACGRCEDESQRVRQDGRPFWVHEITVPLYGQTGVLRGYSRITRDVDDKRRAEVALASARTAADAAALERKKLELEKAEIDVERKNLRNLFAETSALVALVTGPDHLLEYANANYLRMMGGDLLGTSLRQYSASRGDVIELLDAVYGTGISAHRREYAIETNGKTHYFDFVFAARRNSEERIDGVMILATDVTEQLLARHAAEASSASKSAFLANMSHEIRTPLGAILGFGTLLRDAELSSSEFNQYIDTIDRNGKALTRIIDDILDLAKIEAGRLEVESIRFSLVELVSDVTDLFQEKVREKGMYLRLYIDERLPAHICSDPTRLRQILFNIIGNAIKFTECGGVTVHVELVQRAGESLHIAVRVEDTGCGISPKQRSRLFQPFTQADNTTSRHFGGTGLGLALSKRLCEALGGTVVLERSTPKAGSLFIVTFLASVPQQASQPIRLKGARRSVEPSSARLQGVHVLVVDDAPDNQTLVKRFLVKSGASVDVANSGFEAVEKALKSPFDVVLMDIQMPGMDGYQAVRTLHAQGYSKPIIALTAHALVEERTRTREAGFVGHLTKPLDQKTLINMVAQNVPRLGVAISNRP